MRRVRTADECEIIEAGRGATKADAPWHMHRGKRSAAAADIDTRTVMVVEVEMTNELKKVESR